MLKTQGVCWVYVPLKINPYGKNLLIMSHPQVSCGVSSSSWDPSQKTHEKKVGQFPSFPKSLQLFLATPMAMESQHFWRKSGWRLRIVHGEMLHQQHQPQRNICPRCPIRSPHKKEIRISGSSWYIMMMIHHGIFYGHDDDSSWYFLWYFNYTFSPSVFGYSKLTSCEMTKNDVLKLSVPRHES